MEMARTLASRLGNVCQQNAFVLALGGAIAAAVFALATVFERNATVAGFINLCIVVVVPSVCVIAYAAVLMEESVLIRGARSLVLLLGLYICLTLPAAPASEATQWKLPARLAQAMTLLFSVSLIPAGCLRWAGWRLRRASRRNESGEQAVIRDQFGLFDLFVFLTALSVLFAFATAIQRAYELGLSEYFSYTIDADTLPAVVIAAIVTGSVGLAVFCIWFAQSGPWRAWLLVVWLAAWMLLFVFSCGAAAVLDLDGRPAEFFIHLALWVGVLFIPFTAASLIAQWRGWQLMRRLGA